MGNFTWNFLSKFPWNFVMKFHEISSQSFRKFKQNLKFHMGNIFVLVIQNMISFEGKILSIIPLLGLFAHQQFFRNLWNFVKRCETFWNLKKKTLFETFNETSSHFSKAEISHLEIGGRWFKRRFIYLVFFVTFCSLTFFVFYNMHVVKLPCAAMLHLKEIPINGHFFAPPPI